MTRVKVALEYPIQFFSLAGPFLEKVLKLIG